MIKLFVSATIDNGEDISVDLLVYSTIEDVTIFSRPTITHMHNTGIFSKEQVYSLIKETNLSYIVDYLKERGLVVDSDIRVDIYDAVHLMSEMYDNFNLDRIVTRRNIVLKSV